MRGFLERALAEDFATGLLNAEATNGDARVAFDAHPVSLAARVNNASAPHAARHVDSRDGGAVASFTFAIRSDTAAAHLSVILGVDAFKSVATGHDGASRVAAGALEDIATLLNR